MREPYFGIVDRSNNSSKIASQKPVLRNIVSSFQRFNTVISNSCVHGRSWGFWGSNPLKCLCTIDIFTPLIIFYNNIMVKGKWSFYYVNPPPSPL